MPASPDFETQPKAGKIFGFDFVRDPLNADEPFEDLDDIIKLTAQEKQDLVAFMRQL